MAHLKRYAAPDSWHVSKKKNTYVVKTAPGPHNDSAMPVAVWLRDHMNLAMTMREARRDPEHRIDHHQRQGMQGPENGHRGL